MTLDGGTLQMTSASDYYVGQTLLAVINSQISGAFDLTKTGDGTLVLGGANTYSGRTILAGGTLSISADGNLGAAPAAVVADSVRFAANSTLQITGSSNPTLNSNRGITVASGVSGTLEVTSAANTVTYAGLITAAADSTFIKAGQGTLDLRADQAASLLGNLVIDGGTLKLSENGAAVGIAGLTLSNLGTLTLDNTSVVSGDRIAGPITSRGGRINFLGGSALTNETLGPVTLNGGALAINSVPGVAGSTLTIPQLTRNVGGTLFVNAVDLGLGSNQVTFTTAPALVNGLLKYAVVNNGAVTRLARHSGNGTSLEALTTGYETSELNWTAATVNALATADPVMTANRTLYTLTLDGNFNFAAPAGDRTLNMSGAVLQTGGTTTFASTTTNEYIFAWGANEAIYHVYGTLQLDRANTNSLTGTAGLTKAGTGTLILNGASSLTTAAAGSVININEGTLELRGGTSLLPSGSTAVVNLNGATLRLSNNSSTSYSGAVSINADTSVIVDRVTAAATATTHTLGATTLNAGRILSVTSSDITSGTAYGLTLTALTLNGAATVNVANNGTGLGTLTLGATTGTGILTKLGAGDLASSSATTSFSMPINVQEGRVAWSNTSGNVSADALIYGSGGIHRNGAAGTTTLNAQNTFTGSVRVTAGTLAFNTVSNNGGTASNLGQGIDGIELNGGVLSFVGSTNQSTDRGITLLAASTLSAAGVGGATINYAGPINSAGFVLTLTGNAGSEGILSGVLTQTGTAADISVTSGTWTLSGGTKTVADDVIVNGATAVLDLNTTGVLAATTGTSNGLYVAPAPSSTSTPTTFMVRRQDSTSSFWAIAAAATARSTRTRSTSPRRGSTSASRRPGSPARFSARAPSRSPATSIFTPAGSTPIWPAPPSSKNSASAH
ncbi:MAG: autotransporter-associated beta strand repeat-containing protein [Pirellulales bacterium]